MNATEPDIDDELGELETRLERLRSLYEQYFLGIEKIEPNIARKDVDRRIWTLRRMKFRNTAKRFKLQTIVMRYNTYQQYWQRICREIENGTYRRHLIKAEKQAGIKAPLTIAARKRLGMFAKGEEAVAERARSEDAKRSAQDDMAALMDAPQSALDNAMKALDDVFAGKAEPQRASAAASEPAPASSRAPQREPAKKLGKLSLDFGLDGLGSAGRATAGAKPAPTPAKPGASKPGRPATQPGPPPGGVHRPAAVPAHAPATRAPAIATKPGVGTGPGVGRPPPPATRAATRPGVAPPSGSGAPRVPPPAPARAARPPLARPAAPPPVRPPAPQRPPARSAAADAAVSDQRVREIHARLIDAKRQTNDSKSVSVDGLARSLRATEQQLRQKHGNRKIDFDVVIKDGKALLKPTVK